MALAGCAVSLPLRTVLAAFACGWCASHSFVLMVWGASWWGLALALLAGVLGFHAGKWAAQATVRGAQ